MNRLLFLTALATLTHTNCALAGVFPSDFHEAARLSRTNAVEAEAAFLELAARPTRHAQATDAALERASLCAVQRKDFEAAEKHAARVKEPALQTLCRMRILEAQRRWADILETVAYLDKLAVDTITHPDWRCRIRRAYGDVYAALNRPADAVAAYRKALAGVPAAGALRRNARDLKLDGKLDEEFWKQLPPRSLRDLQTGRPPAVGTSFRIAWSGDSLYLGITCEEPDMKGLLQLIGRAS